MIIGPSQLVAPLADDLIRNAQRFQEGLAHLAEYLELRARDSRVIAEVAAVRGEDEHRNTVLRPHVHQCQFAFQQPRDAGDEHRAPPRDRRAGSERYTAIPKKFVLLVAYLAKGQASKEVTIKDVTKNWNRMTSSNLLGGKFNRFYTSVAKENGWVNTPSKGSYTLRSSWMEVFDDA